MEDPAVRADPARAALLDALAGLRLALIASPETRAGDACAMTHDFVFGGVLLSPLVPQLLLAVLLTGLLTFVLMRLNFYRLVWHRPLVELALFCMILGLIVGPDARRLADLGRQNPD